MEIEEITPYSAEFVDTKEKTYIRYNYDNWLESYGESWETVLGLKEVEELEKAYQLFKIKN